MLGSDPSVDPRTDVREKSYTASEPYQPSTGNKADDRELVRMVRAGFAPTIDPNKAARWEPPQGRAGSSLLPPLDESSRAQLVSARDRVSGGEVLSDAEVAQIQLRAIVRLLESRRPMAIASAVRALERVQRRRAEQEKETERHRPRKPIFQLREP